MAKESVLARMPLLAKVGIILGVLAFVGIAYSVVFYGDISQKIVSAQREEDNLRQKLAVADKARAAYDKDLADLYEREERKGEIEKILPSESQYPSFLSSVQMAANVGGVNLIAWTPEKEVPEEFYARVPMRLTLTGRFHQIAKFFYNVSQLDRIINIENISITNPTVEGDDVRVKVEALATAFRSLAEAQEDSEAKKNNRRTGKPQPTKKDGK